MATVEGGYQGHGQAGHDVSFQVDDAERAAAKARARRAVSEDRRDLRPALRSRPR